MSTVCDPNPCPQPTGVCCTSDVCEILTESACTDQDGTWDPEGTNCDPDPCGIVGVPGGGVPSEFRVYASAPNPFRDSTLIRYDLPEVTRVRLRIYDIAGNVVRTLEDGVQSAGQRQTIWDGTTDRGQRVGAGVYFFRLETPSASESRSVIVMK